MRATDERRKAASMPRSSTGGGPRGGGRARTVKALLECRPEALRSQKALLRQWEELPLTQSVNFSVSVFGQSFLTDEPQRLMQGFPDRKRNP